MKYNSGNPIKIVDTNTIVDVAKPDLIEVYEAYRYYYIMVGYPSSKIKSFSEFANSISSLFHFFGYSVLFGFSFLLYFEKFKD